MCFKHDIFAMLVLEKKSFMFFSEYKSMETNELEGMTKLDTWGMVGRIYARDF